MAKKIPPSFVTCAFPVKSFMDPLYNWIGVVCLQENLNLKVLWFLFICTAILGMISGVCFDYIGLEVFHCLIMAS